MKNPLNIIQFVEKKTGQRPVFTSLRHRVLFYNLSTVTLEECQKQMDRDVGNLNLLDCTSLTSLPDGLEVGKSLYLSNCTSLTSLPNGLLVNESLYLRNCKRLPSLPDGLQVTGDLNLENCASLASLPYGLQVDGYLNLENCASLASLPDGLQVTGDLYLYGCNSLTKIGKNIKVGSFLAIDPSVPQFYNLPNEKLVSMFGLKNERRISRR